MSNWDYLNPENGSMASLEGSIASLRNARSGLYNAKLGAEASRELADWDAWSGDAGTTWRVDTIHVYNDIPDVRQTLSDASVAITSYTSEIASIKSAAATQKRKLADAYAIVTHFNGISLNPIDNVNELVRKANAQREMFEAQAAIFALAQRRQAADDALVAALAAALPAAWEDQRAAFASVGLTTAASLTPSAVAGAMLEMARRLNEADGMDYEAVQALSGFLTMYGGDEKVMSLFFEGLGGVDTVRLIDALGNQYMGNGAALEVAQQIRTGLSLVSATWVGDDAEKARAFVDQMFSRAAFGIEGEHFGVDQWAAIGYLFGDPRAAAMGPEFSLAAAEAVDAFEQGGGFPLLTSPVNWQFGGSALLLAENPGMQEALAPGDYIQDVAGAVFQNLANHPVQSLQFLAPAGDPALGYSRVEYWYGERDWTQPDAWASPSALWLGAVQAPGGPTDVAYDPAVGERIAELASNVIPALAENGAFLSENLSDAAALDMAKVIGLQLDSISTFLVGVDGQYITAGQSTFSYTMFGTADERHGPVFDISQLSDVLGQVGAHTDAALTLAGAAALFENSYFGFAEQAGDPALVNQAMLRANVLAGLMDGASIGATIAEAVRHDAALREHIEAVTGAVDFVAGLITVPVPGGYFVDQGIGIVSGIATNAWADSWFASEQEYLRAVANAENQTQANQVFSTFQSASRLYETLNLAAAQFDDPPVLDLTSPDAVDKAREWYEAFYTSGVIDPYVYNLNAWDQAYELGHDAGQHGGSGGSNG